MVTVADRRVNQVEPKLADEVQSERRLFDYIEREVIVLLGDPGAGKTHSFTEMAAREKAPVFSIRRFLALSGALSGGTVYLDGLDEHRPRTTNTDKNVVVELLRALRNCGTPRLRLSCRFADWLGNTDLHLLNDYRSGAVVLGLNPLNRDEAAEILRSEKVADPNGLLDEATKRGLEWIIENPQFLIMLSKVVTGSGWPENKHDLYKKWSLLHLQEHRDEPSDAYSPEELLDPAGAASACMLIADLPAISLTTKQIQETPSYRSVPYSDKEAVLAALRRNAFRTLETGTAAYVHRTVAEFLGARWLGSLVNNGLPLSRLQALTGVDERPSPSLRGLHAWLPIFIPSQAAALIRTDPGGILVYGDIASLKAPQKIAFLESVRLSIADNPSLLINDHVPEHQLRGLSCPETSSHLENLLDTAQEPESLKFLALKAILANPPQPTLKQSIERVLRDPTLNTSLRTTAFQALLQYGSEGERAAIKAYRDSIGQEKRSIGLRASIVSRLYHSNFTPQDTAAILKDAEIRNSPTSDLWALRNIPAPHLIETLEEYQRQATPQRAIHPRDRNWEVPLAVERMLVQVCEWVDAADRQTCKRILDLLRKWYEGDLGAPRGIVHLDRILMDKSGLADSITALAVEHIHEFEQPEILGHTLYRISHGAITPIKAAETLEADLADVTGGSSLSPSQLTKYTALAYCVRGIGDGAEPLLTRLFDVGESRAECAPALKMLTSPKESAPEPDESGSIAQGRQWLKGLVQKYASEIEKGENPALQGELAMWYFGQYTGLKHVRRTEMVASIGETATEVVERGFIAMATSQRPPNLAEIAKLHSENKAACHWDAFIAGMDLLWQAKQSLEGLSQEILTAAFALSILLPTPKDEEGKIASDRSWARQILNDQPKIAETVFRVLLTERLNSGTYLANELYSLRSIDSATWRSDLALELLETGRAQASEREQLFAMAAESLDGRAQLLTYAQERLAKAADSEAPFWPIAAFLLGDDSFDELFVQIATATPATIATVKALTHPQTVIQNSESKLQVSLHKMELIVRTYGGGYQPKPRGSADQGELIDETEGFLAELITKISANPNALAGNALLRLAQDPALALLHPLIKSCLAAQRELNRQSRYERPSWDATCATLSGGAPASIEDLMALFVADLIDAGQDVRHSNTDKYRAYWNTTRFKVQAPRDEEYCRDRLVDYLRERLSKMNCRPEPEGHMAQDKRADIAVYGPGSLKLPVEVKRDTNPDLWTAPMNQLERQYARDPQAAGYGVYLVLYFGPDRGIKMTSHPRNDHVPEDPRALEQAIAAQVPQADAHKIKCLVFDVSPPSRGGGAPLKPPGKRKHAEPSGKSPSSRTDVPGRARSSKPPIARARPKDGEKSVSSKPGRRKQRRRPS
jgi:hypothetical protein